LSAVAQDRIIGVASVIDGDSIEIHGQRIRLFGIELPAPRRGRATPGQAVFASPLSPSRAYRWHSGAVG
jgi:endonuclease YncB( thermonuclease family)